MTQQFTPAQLEAWAGLGPWKSQGQEPDGVYIIGLRTDKDGVPYDNPTNGLVGAALPFPTELDNGDFTRVLANAALIAAAPDLARLVLEKDKEIAEWKENTIAFLGPWAVDYAKQIGLPDGHIHHVHYDLLEKAGARLNAFTRHPPSHEGNQ